MSYDHFGYPDWPRHRGHYAQYTSESGNMPNFARSDEMPADNCAAALMARHADLVAVERIAAAVAGHKVPEGVVGDKARGILVECAERLRGLSLEFPIDKAAE
jgi:hypothetical protein